MKYVKKITNKDSTKKVDAQTRSSLENQGRKAVSGCPELSIRTKN